MLIGGLKNFIQKVTNNSTENFTGMTSPCDEPKNPSLKIDTDKHNADETATILRGYVKKLLNRNIKNIFSNN